MRGLGRWVCHIVRKGFENQRVELFYRPTDIAGHWTNTRKGVLSQPKVEFHQQTVDTPTSWLRTMVGSPIYTSLKPRKKSPDLRSPGAVGPVGMFLQVGDLAKKLESTTRWGPPDMFVGL